MVNIQSFRLKSVYIYYFTNGIERCAYSLIFSLGAIALVLFAYFDDYPLFYLAALISLVTWVIYIMGNILSPAFDATIEEYNKKKELR